MDAVPAIGAALSAQGPVAAAAVAGTDGSFAEALTRSLAVAAEPGAVPSPAAAAPSFPATGMPEPSATEGAIAAQLTVAAASASAGAIAPAMVATPVTVAEAQEGPAPIPLPPAEVPAASVPLPEGSAPLPDPPDPAAVTRAIVADPEPGEATPLPSLPLTPSPASRPSKATSPADPPESEDEETEAPSEPASAASPAMAIAVPVMMPVSQPSVTSTSTIPPEVRAGMAPAMPPRPVPADASAPAALAEALPVPSRPAEAPAAVVPERGAAPAAAAPPSPGPTVLPPELAALQAAGRAPMVETVATTSAVSGAASPPPARQVASVAVALAFAPGVSNGFSLSLEPVELGRVEVRVQRDGDSHSVRVTAERPETLALLQRDRHELDRGLAEAGLRVESGGISFSLDTPDAGAGSGFGDRPAPGQRGNSPGGVTRLPAPEREASPPRLLRSLLDLNI